MHSASNELERSVGTHLLGRRMYETMAAWDMPEMVTDQPRHITDFAEAWRATEKVVYSTSLEAATTPNARIERSFDRDEVLALKAAATRDISVGGPNLAGHAFAAALVDEVHMFLVPVAVGGGKRALPAGQRIDLELLDERRFASGFVHLHYRVSGA